MDERKAVIREFVAKYLHDEKLLDDQDIFASGFVHSLLALQLVRFVETKFSVFLEDRDLDLENFRTVNAIDELLRRKLG